MISVSLVELNKADQGSNFLGGRFSCRGNERVPIQFKLGLFWAIQCWEITKESQISDQKFYKTSAWKKRQVCQFRSDDLDIPSFTAWVAPDPLKLQPFYQKHLSQDLHFLWWSRRCYRVQINELQFVIFNPFWLCRRTPFPDFHGSCDSMFNS